MKKFTKEEWLDIAHNLFEAITQEINKRDEVSVEAEFSASKYAKLAIMYEFFRLWRGEAFHDIRPWHDKQTELYKMEDEIMQMLKTYKSKIIKDSMSEVYINEAKKIFDL